MATLKELFSTSPEFTATLFQLWDLVFAIGGANRKFGCVPTGYKLLWQTWREHGRLVATYPLAD